MEEAITQFIHSDTGKIVAYILLFVGITDVITGVVLSRYYPHLIENNAVFIRVLPFLYFTAAFLALLGLYMLYLRA